jgi:hypothetical protein
VTVLVELCAGSAAVSLRWMSAKQRPPFGWMGSKAGYADQVLEAMGLLPGGAAEGDLVYLAEPGPWNLYWHAMTTSEVRARVEAVLRGWAGEDPESLWRRLAAAPVPESPTDRVAAWMVLMFWGFGTKPVLPHGEKWKTHGFSRTTPYRADIAKERRARGEHYDVGQNLRIPQLLARQPRDLRCLSNDRIYLYAGSLRPIPGALCYLDPPYDGVTQGYGHTLTRKEVLALGTRWNSAGAHVYISEAEPLPLTGWHHLELSPPRGRGRTFSRQQREFLTISPAAPVPHHLLYPGLA